MRDAQERHQFLSQTADVRNRFTLGTVCIYLATRTEAIRRHAGLPVDEIIPVADAVVVRPDRMA